MKNKQILIGIGLFVLGAIVSLLLVARFGVPVQLSGMSSSADGNCSTESDAIGAAVRLPLSDSVETRTQALNDAVDAWVACLSRERTMILQ